MVKNFRPEYGRRVSRQPGVSGMGAEAPRSMRTFLNPLGILFVLGLLAAPALRAAGFDWPQWRGSDRSGVSQDTGLLQSWPDGGPQRIWLFERAGIGYSGPAIVDGKLFTLGTRGENEILLVLDALTGRELWTVPLGEVLDNDRGGGPRGTPTVDGDRVYALTALGRLVCASVSKAELLWQLDLSDLGGRRPGRGYSESVLVDGGQVVCTPGGPRGTLAALDKRSGKLRWLSREFTERAHYSSIVPARINDTAQYVQRTEKFVVGIAASDGRLLWQTDFQGRTAVIPTPIVRGDEIYVTAGYGAGCKMVRIGPGNTVTTVYENKEMKNHHGGVVLVGDYLYGHADPSWVGQNFETGEAAWYYRGFGKGAVGYADGRLYCVDERSGVVTLVEVSPAGWKEHGRFTLDPQTTIRVARGGVWTHPVISNGRLYLRDQDLIYCFDIRAR